METLDELLKSVTDLVEEAQVINYRLGQLYRYKYNTAAKAPPLDTHDMWNHGDRWTVNDVHIMKCMLKARCSFEEIAIALRRGTRAIISKAEKLYCPVA